MHDLQELRRVAAGERGQGNPLRRARLAPASPAGNCDTAQWVGVLEASHDQRAESS
jgi:hypothetical protein